MMSEHTIIDGINYGPLAALIGSWEGDKGIDRAPTAQAAGPSHCPSSTARAAANALPV
jgi:hypothetical protein